MGVSAVAVVAVPVKLPVTSPVIFPTSPVDTTNKTRCHLFKMPTTTSGVPLKLNAVDAVPNITS